MIRSSFFGIDEILCAAQGAAGAYLVNIVRGVTVFNPLNAALCFGGFAFMEKVIYDLSKRIIPGYTAFLGPIPIGTKNFVSYGMATYLTFKIMEVAGLILSVPQAITVIGLVCATALVIGGVKALIEHNMKSFGKGSYDK